MSDLHQYEISYNYRDDETHFRSKKTLVWAYTVQEAVFQLTLEWTQYRITLVITEAGPVKKALSHFGVEHFHVCPECRDVVPCEELAVCLSRGQSDLQEPCRKCRGRKPHKHFCSICAADFDCGWVQEKGPCSAYGTKDVPCTKHTFLEAQDFFQKKLDAEKKAAR